MLLIVRPSAMVRRSELSEPDKKDRWGEPVSSILGLLKASKNIPLIFLDQKGIELLPFSEEVMSRIPLIFAVRGNVNLPHVISASKDMVILQADQADFVDRLRDLSKGEGFPTVIVLDKNPHAIRQALGAAGVLGSVHLYLIPEGLPEVDLNTTINYKSLVVYGHSWLNGD